MRLLAGAERQAAAVLCLCARGLDGRPARGAHRRRAHFSRYCVGAHLHRARPHSQAQSPATSRSCGGDHVACGRRPRGVALWTRGQRAFQRRTRSLSPRRNDPVRLWLSLAESRARRDHHAVRAGPGARSGGASIQGAAALVGARARG